MSAKTCIILLNYNGWQDTVECLESILRSDRRDFQVVVCDNDSADGSIERISAWARGELNSWTAPENPLRRHSFPPLGKPVPFVVYDRGEAEAGGSPEAGQVPLVLVRTGGNLGFAGGNNVGLRYALARPEFGHAWLLNNDTVVCADALDALVARAAEYAAGGARVGIIGSKILHYHAPDVIQGVGGIYSKLSGTTRHLGVFEKDRGQYDRECSDSFHYPIGASLFVSRAFLEEVGLMCEDYFLYYEEMDWVLRARQKGWRHGYCWRGAVYHKEGASIGSNTKGQLQSAVSDFWKLRNRILFARRFYPRYLPSVYAGFAVVLANRARRGQFDRIPMILRLARRPGAACAAGGRG